MEEDRKLRRENSGTPLKLVTAESLRDREREIHDTIAEHAYRLFEARGRQDGHHLEDWLAAEREVLHLCRRELKETTNSVICMFEVGSFDADDLNVSVEPHRVTVSGERNVNALRADERGTHEERHPVHIFRTVEFPAEVDPSKASAILKGTRLEIVMPKVTAVKTSSVKANVASPSR